LLEEPRIYADGARIQQVILNLLDNSAQHSPTGSQIQVAIFEKNGTTHLRVSDQGPGVPADNLPRLFEPFFTTRPSGIGLGLSLVKHIIETHGGEVVLYNNDPGPGVTVEISFKNSVKHNDVSL
ncbi:MAG TPA: sensor histidine kinase, partial [Acidobacteriota bacterium]